MILFKYVASQPRGTAVPILTPPVVAFQEEHDIDHLRLLLFLGQLCTAWT